jgi:hypothetical protein
MTAVFTNLSIRTGRVGCGEYEDMLWMVQRPPRNL